MLPEWMIPEDLAPGDRKSIERDWGDVELFRISHAGDPLFSKAYGRLWQQFGAGGEMETEEVIRGRLAWDDAHCEGGCALRYRLMLVLAGETIAAVRDHTAIVSEGLPGAVVHMSHNLVEKEWRRSGLAGWMRALPIQTARHALESQGRPAKEPITLVGEMDPPDPEDPSSLVRLAAYEKAGFLKADPAAIPYVQPDFGTPEEIDARGGPRPIPMQLILRRVGRESETEVDASEMHELAMALYRMYSRGFRASDMAASYETLQNYAPAGTKVNLLPPTAV